MHDGNLLFHPGLQLAPVYDMQAAPQAGVELPNRRVVPPLPLPAECAAWASEADGATQLWQRVSTDTRISARFR